ncbi:hypothetical protein L1S32_09525 [Methanogenium sp. S4BF]|uniref:hypothetical protein n=1 Tax=Methanogenium sp. S4BF TaxID=1789226 RepID=UPI0024160015|nr:hypothetical protein [Methanogenium sp. S4BF]WFN34080.1 hypothetical protein L1S32_09525 [Methanogenium sp. S4BF]
MKTIRKICILAACCALLGGTAAGYTIAFTVNPSETMPGGMVTITGTSTIPAGYADEAILYREVPNYPAREAGRYPFTVAEGGNWGFVIDTTGFLPATYKIQLSKSGEYPYGSSAVLMQTFVVTAPPETPVPATTPASTLTPIPAASPKETAPSASVPAPTTSPGGVGTVLAAAGISALGCASALRRRNE